MLTSLLAIVCFVSFFHSFADLVAVFGCCSSVVLPRTLFHILVLEFGHIQRLPKPLLLSGFSSSCDFGELVLVLFWSLWLHILDLILATPFSSLIVYKLDTSF